MSALKLTLISLGVGILYYLGAYLGVTHASLPSGIPILWPPNAVLLAAMLSLPMRYWPYLAASALFAVVIAVTPFSLSSNLSCWGWWVLADAPLLRYC